MFASSIARAVLKQGRTTVRPDAFFRDCELLPEEEDHGQTGRSPECGDSQDIPRGKSQDQRDIMEAIESRRLKGLKVAENLNRLDTGMALFDAREEFVYARL